MMMESYHRRDAGCDETASCTPPRERWGPLCGFNRISLSQLKAEDNSSWDMYENVREGTSSTTEPSPTWSCVSAGPGLVVLSNICSVSIYWKEMLDWPVSRLDWVQGHRWDNQNSSSRPKCIYLSIPASEFWLCFGCGWQNREMRASGIRLQVTFPRIAEFPPRLRYWQHQPGAESCCPVELSRRRGEIRMEHGCDEDFNRGGSLFGVLRFGTDCDSDQHWQLVRDGREEAPGTLQELFKQKKRPRIHLHLQQQPATSHVAEGEKCGEEGLQRRRRDAAAGEAALLASCPGHGVPLQSAVQLHHHRTVEKVPPGGIRPGDGGFDL